MSQAPQRQPGSATRDSAPRSARLDAEVPDPGAHLDFALAQFTDPLVAPWHGGRIRDRDGMRAWLAAQAAQQADAGFCLWWWRERSSGELVGYAGLNRDHVDGEPVVEVGWSVTPPRWGEGFAPEGARAAVAWAFERCGLDRVVSFTLPENRRSQRVMEKLGMSHKGEFERAGLPHVLYELRAHDAAS